MLWTSGMLARPKPQPRFDFVLDSTPLELKVATSQENCKVVGTLRVPPPPW